MQPPKKTVLLVIDIEKGGNRLDHPLLAIGFCLGDLDRGVIEKRTWCCRPQPGQAWEMRCVYEFWCKHPDVMRRIDVEGKPLREQMTSIAEYLASVDARFPTATHNVVVVSDNPSFDIGHFDYYFCGALPDQPPLHYSRANEYRTVEDPSERLEALHMWGAERTLLETLAKHDHWPDNDAEKVHPDPLSQHFFVPHLFPIRSSGSACSPGRPATCCWAGRSRRCRTSSPRSGARPRTGSARASWPWPTTSDQ